MGVKRAFGLCTVRTALLGLDGGPLSPGESVEPTPVVD